MDENSEATGAEAGGRSGDAAAVIGEVRRQRVARTAVRPSATGTAGQAAVDAERDALAAIAQTFLRDGRDYRFPDGAAAFSDRGESLVSQSENPVVVRALVQIAVAREWQSLSVSGTAPFRQRVWAEATERGIEVNGYTPDAAERARVGARTSRGEREADSEPESPAAAGETQPAAVAIAAPRPRRPIAGELLEHGRAPYRHESDNPMSYFARVKTPAGEKIVWGVDLVRAFRESVSAPKVGDDVVLRPVSAEPVTIRSVPRGDGEVGVETRKSALRNRWSVETRAFVESRQEAAQALQDPSRDPKEVVHRQPELAGAYLAMRGAEEIARTRIPHPDDQSKFVNLVRSAVSDGIERGDPLPQVKLRGRAMERDRSREAREPGEE